MDDKRPSVKDILKKHSAKIEGMINLDSSFSKKDYSSSYDMFKREMAPELTRYERWCKSLGSIIKLNASEKDRREVEKYLKIAHLDLEPWQPLTLSVMAFVSVFFIGLISSVAVALIGGGVDAFSILYFFLMVVLSLFLFYFVNGYPQRLANQFRLKASSQMVPAILYVVVYMRHTANLERAIAF